MKTIDHLRDLTSDPRNARSHNPRNVGVIEDALREVGAARSIVIDEAGVVLAGNATIEAAAAAGIERVQVVEADGRTIIAVRRTGLTDAQKTRLALYDNRAAELAGWDAGVLAVLLDEDAHALDGMFVKDEVDALLASVGSDGDAGDDADGPALTRADVPDALMPTDNEWGVPLLDNTHQATTLDLPVSRWGQTARSARMPGTWHFYTDDYRFEALWTDPSPIVNSRCVNIIEPNYSTNEQMPRAVALWFTYRKRWLARYWQGFGTRVFVDLNVAQEHAEINMLGVPRGWQSYATRGYERWIDDLDDQHAAACERAGTAGIVYAVYGGGGAIRERCQERGWVWVPEEADYARGRYRDG